MPAKFAQILRFPALWLGPFLRLFCPKNLCLGRYTHVCMCFHRVRQNRCIAWNHCNPLQIKNSRDFSLEPEQWWRWWESNPRPRAFPKDFLRAQPIAFGSLTLRQRGKLGVSLSREYSYATGRSRKRSLHA